jgi:hypothetical protein
MLLYIGDILAAYGVLLFLGVWALRWKGPLAVRRRRAGPAPHRIAQR